MESLQKVLLVFLICCNVKIMAEGNSFMSKLEEKFQDKLSIITDYVASSLENFNDRHLGNSELGKLLHYEELKPKFSVGSSRKGKSLKKMGMAMIPLIFHVGAASTFMLLTSIMAAKSVAIGLVLLIFKIAVSSAKLAAFFTKLKAKHGHHEYSWSPPHSEHGVHGYGRSLPGPGSYYPADWNSYIPESHDASPPYNTIPTYKHHEEPTYEVEYEDKKSHS